MPGLTAEEVNDCDSDPDRQSGLTTKNPQDRKWADQNAQTT